jgi:hypothetical protein
MMVSCHYAWKAARLTANELSIKTKNGNPPFMRKNLPCDLKVIKNFDICEV